MTRPAPMTVRDDDDDAFALTSGERYFNRELSWLAFNRRVLDEACNPAHPLLERLRFLAISGSNLDEFFMVRVAGLKGQQLQDVDRMSPDGLTAGQQLAAIVAEADRLVESQRVVWRTLRAQLADIGIAVLGSRTLDETLSTDEIAWLETHFREQIFPILTPQALDPAHPFPFMPNKGLAVMFDLVRAADDAPVRELVMLPAALPRFVRLPGEQARYVAAESLVKRFSALVFPGYRVLGAAEFRVLRDSDIEIEEEAEDLVRYFANAIKRRRRGRVIRLELETGMPDSLSQVLRGELGGADALVTEGGAFLGVGDLSDIVDEDRPDLKFPPYTPR
ncbi:MAG: RNA degradosome polyphosphate kinase, partial [Sphingomonas sp.]